jgi:hypothetical protein
MKQDVKLKNGFMDLPLETFELLNDNEILLVRGGVGSSSVRLDNGNGCNCSTTNNGNGGSLLSDKVVDLIKKNIVQKYKEPPYKELKISFFGGEPLINFNAIRNITLFCENFSKQKDFRLTILMQKGYFVKKQGKLIGI